MKKNLGVAGELFPQSVFIVASYGEDGTPNAMNVAWGGECTRTQVAINIGDHKTTDNILARGAFTVAPADAAHVAEADYFGIATGRRVNKAEGSGLTFTRSEFVDAPVIEEFPPHHGVSCGFRRGLGRREALRWGDRQHPRRRGGARRRGARRLLSDAPDRVRLDASRLPGRRGGGRRRLERGEGLDVGSTQQRAEGLSGRPEGRPSL